jgi:hydrogenase maturation protease
MNSSLRDVWPTVVAGFGSPHGDDQAGWRLAGMLKRRTGLPARVIAVHEATQLLEALEDCRRLIIVDACQSGGPVGSITQLRWPDARIAERHHHSTHGVGICGSLQLACRLGRMPPQVDVFGIEVEDCSPGRDICPAVMEAVVRLESRIVNELRGVVHA